MRRYQNAYCHWSRGLQFQSTSGKYQHRTNPYGPPTGMQAQQPAGRHTFRRSCKTNSSQHVSESAMATAIFPDDLQESFQQGTLTLFSSGQAVKKDVSKRRALMSLSISQNQDRTLEVLSPEPVVETSKWKCSDQHEQIKDYMFTVFPRIYSRSQWKKRINNLKSIANVDTNKQKLLERTDRTEPDKVPDELFKDWTKEKEMDISAKHSLINSKSTVSQSKQILAQVNRVSDCKCITNEVKKDMTKLVIFTIKEDNEGICKEINSEVVSSGAWLNTRKYHEPSNINALAYSDNVGHMLESKVSGLCARQNASQSVTMHVMVEQDRNTPCLKSEQPNTIKMENKFVSSVDHNEINSIKFQKGRASPGLDGQSEDMFPNTPEENQIPAFLENKSVTNKYAISLIHENCLSDAENLNDCPFLDKDELIYPSQNIDSRRFSLGLMNNSKNGNISNVDLDADDMVYPSQERSTCLFNKTILPCQNQIKGDSVTGSNFTNSEVLVPSEKTQLSPRPKDAKVTVKVIFPCQDQIVNGDPTAGSHFTRDEAVFSLGKRQILRTIEDSKPQSDERDNHQNQQNSSQDDDEVVPPSQNSDTTKLLKALPDIYKFIVPSLDTYALHDNNDNLSLYSEEKTFLHKMKR